MKGVLCSPRRRWLAWTANLGNLPLLQRSYCSILTSFVLNTLYLQFPSVQFPLSLHLTVCIMPQYDKGEHTIAFEFYLKIEINKCFHNLLVKLTENGG